LFNVISGDNPCSFLEWYKTHKYNVRHKIKNYLMLKLMVYVVAIVLEGVTAGSGWSSLFVFFSFQNIKTGSLSLTFSEKQSVFIRG
jgi:hypothetical protein